MLSGQLSYGVMLISPLYHPDSYRESYGVITFWAANISFLPGRQVIRLIRVIRVLLHAGMIFAVQILSLSPSSYSHTDFFPFVKNTQERK
jgi:hypothetical protein